jgi:phosphopantetheinyl transferase (holo-ACP synthase)
MSGRSLSESDIMTEENRRPYFSGGREDFNISHSGALTAVSLVTGEKLRTGCDVELVKPRSGIIRIAEEFFSASERDYVLRHEKTQYDETAFFEIWTLKECFLKLYGLSVFDMKKTPSFVSSNGNGRFHFALDYAAERPLTFYLYELKGASDERYILAAAIEGALRLRPEIRWFSQSVPSASLTFPTLPARSIAEINAARSPAETVSPNS